MASRLLKVIVGCLILTGIMLSGAHAVEQVSFTSSSSYAGRKVVLTGALYSPGGPGKHPAVVLMHGCSGLEPVVLSGLRSHARYLVRNGFAALILDSFGPRGISDGWVCKTTTRLDQARIYRTRDAIDARKYLASRGDMDTRNIFAMGQSNGGSVTVKLALKGLPAGFRALTAYYPWCGALSAGRSPTPLLILSGAKDDWTPPQACQKRHNPARGITVKVYPNAVHSFDLNFPVTTYLGYRVGSDRAATSDSRRQMVRFFKRHLAE